MKLISYPLVLIEYITEFFFNKLHSNTSIYFEGEIYDF